MKVILFSYLSNNIFLVLLIIFLHRFQERVTEAIPSTFRTFNIKLYPTILSNIKRILSNARPKHFVPFKLKISIFPFHGYSDVKLRKFLAIYSGNIISLNMEISDRVDQEFLFIEHCELIYIF